MNSIALKRQHASVARVESLMLIKIDLKLIEKL